MNQTVIEVVAKIQMKMMDRALNAFESFPSSYGIKQETLFKFLMDFYNTYNEALITDIIQPHDLKSKSNATDVVIAIRRLNRGYANFYYDTKVERLYQLIQEAQAKGKYLDDSDDEEQNTEPSFPEQAKNGDDE